MKTSAPRVMHHLQSGTHLSASPETGLQALLQGILKTITRLPWLHTDAGGVFIANDGEQRLELVAHVNFTPQIQGACTRVAFGRCLCGRVALSGRLLHVDCVDQRHEIRYEGMSDHGHYVVPISDHTGLLGVFVLYVEAGHTYRQAEADALHDFAATMATVIQTTRMRRDKALADLVIENSSHGVMIADRAKRILWVNRAFEQTTGYRLEQVRGKTPRILSSGRHGPDFYRRMWREIEAHGRWQGEIWNRRQSGEIYPEWLNIVALKDEQGRVERYAGIFVDLTEIRRAEEHIHRLAYFDGLTGLPNRAKFSEDLAALLRQAHAQGQQVVVLLLDLDHFHEINDALGRETGDALLREAGTRLAKALKGHLLARIEPDQFLVAIVPGESCPEGALDGAQARAEQILQVLASEFVFDNQVLTLDATIGLAVSKAGDTVETLLSHAALALRQAKQAARGGIGVFDEQLGREVEYDNHIALNIRHAASRGELFLMYQAQVDQQGCLTGAEALLRWQSPGIGLISPGRFIRYAEKRGAIATIGHWVFEQAVKQFSEWRKQPLFEGREFTLSVNLSPAQLISNDVAEMFAETCERYQLSPSLLEIEVIESAIMQVTGQVYAQLEALSALGFRIAIDDFGTGYSSLSRLHEFPIDTFKIDRSFIICLEDGGRHLSVVKSMIAMAHELGHTVIAEGVENERQFNMLRELACDRFQGFWFSKPVTREAFERYAASMWIDGGRA